MRTLAIPAGWMLAVILSGCAMDPGKSDASSRSESLKSDSQSSKLISCSREATDKNLTGDMRRLYIESCSR